MDTFSQLVQGFVEIFTLQNILMIMLGVVSGSVIGALPGLTATMAVALMTPITYTMSPIAGISLLLGVYVSGTYGGSISAIMIKTPGTPAAAATVLDGYPLAQKGQARKALEMAIYASAFGGMFSALALIFTAPQLAKVALEFGPPEYFALGLFGLAVIGGVAGETAIKGFLAGMLGVFFALIGMDPMTGAQRFTFGFFELSSGITFMAMLIGLFAVSEVFSVAESIFADQKASILQFSGERLRWKELKASGKTMLKGSVIGTIVGAIPGTGAAIAAFLSYNEAKRSSKHSERYGTGELDGVAASESANNAVTGSTLIPLLTLGIPGDVVVAVMVGAFMMKGLTPGPMLFKEHGPVVFALLAGLVIANILMTLFGFVASKYFSRIAYVPKRTLFPVIVALCFIGTYAINTNYLDLYIMLFFGLLGYLLNKNGFATAPILLGFILGPMVEHNLRLSLLMSGGSWSIFFSRPIAVVFLAIAIFTIVFFYVKTWQARSRARTATGEEQA